MVNSREVHGAPPGPWDHPGSFWGTLLPLSQPGGPGSSAISGRCGKNLANLVKPSAKKDLPFFFGVVLEMPRCQHTSTCQRSKLTNVFEEKTPSTRSVKPDRLFPAHVLTKTFWLIFCWDRDELQGKPFPVSGEKTESSLDHRAN